MKIAPVSADLLIKLALASAAVGLLWYVGTKIASAGQGAITAAGQALQLVNPASTENVAYQTANTVTEAITGDSSFGGWLYSVTHPDPMTQNTGGATGAW